MPKELNLNLIPAEVMKVTIGETVYTVPLATALPLDKVKGISKALKDLKKVDAEDTIDEQLEIFVDFFKDYIPEEVLRPLPMKALQALADMWGDTSDESGNLGES